MVGGASMSLYIEKWLIWTMSCLSRMSLLSNRTQIWFKVKITHDSTCLLQMSGRNGTQYRWNERIHGGLLSTPSIKQHYFLCVLLLIRNVSITNEKHLHQKGHSSWSRYSILYRTIVEYPTCKRSARTTLRPPRGSECRNLHFMHRKTEGTTLVLDHGSVMV